MKSTARWRVYKEGGNWRVSYRDAWGVMPVPVVFVSWRDAMSYVVEYPSEVTC